MSTEVHEMIMKIGDMDNPQLGITSSPATDAILAQYRNSGWVIAYESPMGFENGLVVKNYRLERELPAPQQRQAAPSVKDVLESGKAVRAALNA